MDAAKAKEKLGWQPRYTLDEMIKEMVTADIEVFRRDILLKEGGYSVVRGQDS